MRERAGRGKHARVEQGDRVADAQVSLDTAKLNLQRTTIVSPVDGYLNDRAPRVGEYDAGRPRGAVGRRPQFVPRRRLLRGNQAARHPHRPTGRHHRDGRAACAARRVQSIVAAIEDRDRTQGANLLPNVNPAFSWVRLAQRVPVRVVLDEVPDDFRMIAGRTATVSMREADTRRND